MARSSGGNWRVGWVLFGVVAGAAGPALAASTGLTPRGNAAAQAATAKIDTPYPNRFIFSTNRDDYPATEDAFSDESDSLSGAIHVVHSYDGTDAGVNVAAGNVDGNGVFSASAKIENWGGAYANGYSGLLADTYWSRAYRITDPDTASITYHVSAAYLEAYVFGGSVRSEIVFDVNLYIPLFGPGVYSNTHEQAGLFALSLDTQTVLEEGPMTYVTDKPRGNGGERVIFDPFTGAIDVSGLLEGQIVIVEYLSLAAVSFAGIEVSQGWAYFQDPVTGSGGFSIETTGMEAVPEPGQLALVGLASLAAAARLLSMRK